MAGRTTAQNAGRLRAILLAAGIVAAPTAAVADAATPTTSPVNLPAPTMGGLQLWADAFVHAGWRIQQNVLTGHYRLLDRRDRRRAWGSYADSYRAFDDLRGQQRLAPSSRHLVLVLHGILGFKQSVADMEAGLRAAGFDAVAVNYPSTRRTLAQHAEQLAELLARTEGADTVSFVSHSMGGLVVRQLLARPHAWQHRLRTHRVVMIAPPSQGAHLADRLAHMSAYNLVLGDGGGGLTTAAARALPAPPVSFGIIAGGRGDGAGLNPLLPGDDDGLVGVTETDLAGAADRLLLPEHHYGIAEAPATIAATIQFLRHGRFRD